MYIVVQTAMVEYGVAYRLAKRPMQNDAKAEIAAVDVTRSLFTSFTQRAYSRLVEHETSSGSLQMQLPPESETTDALTAIT